MLSSKVSCTCNSSSVTNGNNRFWLFFLANFSMENRVENYQLLVQTTSKRNLNTPNMYYNATYLNEEIILYTETNLKSTKQLQNYSASALYPHSLEQPFKAHLETGHRNFSQKSARNRLFLCSNFKFINTKYNYQGNCML